MPLSKFVVSMTLAGLVEVGEVLSFFDGSCYRDGKRERGGEDSEVEDGALCGLLCFFFVVQGAFCNVRGNCPFPICFVFVNIS